MLFPTFEYVLFFTFTLALAWGVLRLPPNVHLVGARQVPRHGLHKLSLLALSYIFYACWDWHFVPLLFALSMWAWVATRIIQHGRWRRLSLAVGICGCLGVLAYYKYSEFAVLNLLELATMLGRHPLLQPESPFLPLGISFMTFHAISLMMDAWRHKLDERVPLVDALLYVSFFPQLIAGPILRASTFLPQLRRPPDPSRIETTRALMLVTAGLFKKVLVANTLATMLVDDVFSAPLTMSASQVLMGIYGYAAQIYCDFSGYTDIAIGCALLLGYSFPENFDSPYVAASPQEFWHRWHISLSSWLRDYLFIPLGGSRQGRWTTHFNLGLTMLLGGLWHGAAWTFVGWGAWHGLLLVGHREWDRFWTNRGATWRSSPFWLWGARLLLFHAVCLGWVIFRASDFLLAGQVLQRLWTGGWALDVPAGPMLCIIVGIGCQYLPRHTDELLQSIGTEIQPVWRGMVFALLLMLCEVLGPSAPAPFIYFQF